MRRRPGKATALARYALGLRGYLRTTMSEADCEAAIRRRLERRRESFLFVVEHGIYGNPGSPYLALLRHLDIELGDVVALVYERGIEGALAHLHAAGVRLSLDEFKGRTPIRRAGIELCPDPHDFDNPLLLRYFDAATSGSTGVARRIHIDLDLLAHEAAYQRLFLSGFALDHAPIAIWRPAPPGQAGLKTVLRLAKTGRSVDAWFTQYAQPLNRQALRYRLFTDYTLRAGRRWGVAMPKRPLHVPLEDAERVARWLADTKTRGPGPLIDTPWSSAVRVCFAAQELGLDISSAFFKVGGEPSTPARAAAIKATGADFAVQYSMGEVGQIGLVCSEAAEIGEVHLATDKLALLPPANGTAAPRTLHMTTLLPSGPKVLLNVDSGDHAHVGERECGCPFGRLGMTTKLWEIGSREKLTSEGMHFTGDEVIVAGGGGASRPARGVARRLPARRGPQPPPAAGHSGGQPVGGQTRGPRRGARAPGVAVDARRGATDDGRHLGRRRDGPRRAASAERDGPGSEGAAAHDRDRGGSAVLSLDSCVEVEVGAAVLGRADAR